ncbi:hypothetical protein AVEN_238045-1 [Araneus ventricosus]|uniref:Uncharacterized protein n=1 Tax=Araneus ventricosus TaxID=182803 RepID=A0A4Y2FIW9_ARAVE|nr:hypothetical protein AVEN_193290-1 [Araneus ventricosus]GBM40375.1 hypothetical protein AVEN_238045-1 [Araneus ventricosus]
MINVRRCSILHENDALKASTLLKLLKLKDYKIPHHITVPLSCDGVPCPFNRLSSHNGSRHGAWDGVLSCDGTVLDSICSYLYKKYGRMIKVAVNPHHTVTL